MSSLTTSNNPMASNTTNLINININNGAGLTAVATGENHLIQNNGNYLSATPTNTLPRRGTLVNNNEQLNLTNYQVGNNCSNQDLANGATSTRDGQCTLQNCDLNPNNCSLIRSSSSLSSNGGGCYSAPSTMKNHQHIQTSNQNLAQILANNQSSQHMYDQFIDCMGSGVGNGTILPPPLFDNGCNNFSQCYEMPGNNYCTMSAIDLPKAPSSSGGSKRLHRTIPKHFTMSSPSTAAILPTGGQTLQTAQQPQPSRSNVAEQKKPTCQCPVQHVPMNYMNSMQYNQPPSQQQIETQPAQAIQVAQNAQYAQPSHQRYHSNYSSSKKNNVSKSTTFPSNMNASSGSHKIQTITAEMLNCSGNDGQTSHHNDLTTSINGGGTLRRSHHKSTGGSGSHGTPNKKIATISAATPSTPSASFISSKENKHHGHHQPNQQIHSILKNKNHGECPDPACSEPNPILPPKMYKHSNRYSCNSAPTQSTPKIHTITRPNDLQTIASSSHFSLLAITNNPKLIHHQQQQQAAAFHQPTLLRTNLQVFSV